ncbi:Thioesterase/thiol ester dehydrase-isomerase [Xylaria sp. CBS 124048]|nr:Thioesterase/thiol ester dehydrase-isomerase [Xylaria sp. CBS 124048]
MSSSEQPVKRSDGRYDNVDFRKAVGHKFSPIKCTYNRRDVLLFANAIGAQTDEKHFLYEMHPRFAAFPTFPVNLAFKQTDKDAPDVVARAVSEPVPGTPPLDAERSVNFEHGIEIVNSLPTSSTGLELEIHSKVLGVYDEEGAMVFEREHELMDVKTGTTYSKMTSTELGIGQGGYDGPKWPSRPNSRMPARRPDAVYTFKTTRETALLYRLCGDYNPLHTDDASGKRAGFKGAILQDLCTWNIAAHGLLRAVAESNPAKLKAFGARFKSVVYPGDELETRIFRTGFVGDVDDYVFETIVKSNGRVALSNGYAKIKQQSNKL